MKLKDRVAIVTGSTSGMGRAIAKKFAQEGAKVVVTGRNEERAKAVVDDIRAEGGEAVYVIVDTSNTDDCKVLLDKTLEEYGTVDILVNNAGMLSMALPSMAWSFPNSGSPHPTGTPLATQLTTAPTVSPAARTSVSICSTTRLSAHATPPMASTLAVMLMPICRRTSLASAPATTRLSVVRDEARPPPR